MKLLPIGNSTLATIIQGNGIYVDKTQSIWSLWSESVAPRIFLARPRRFGKSLLIDTLKSLFEGKKDIFQGLYIYDKRDWTKTWPVIKISFGKGVLGPDRFDPVIQRIFKTVAKQYDISLNLMQAAPEIFLECIELLMQKTGLPVVILIDEYDKAILDNISNISEALEIREKLKNFYSVIKDHDDLIQFVFITGVTKFSKVSLFSGLNNLDDISINPQYGAICGYTTQEIDQYFTPEGYMEEIDAAKMQKWYNGYNFLGPDKVYNPYSLLYLFSTKEYNNIWFQTGTPSFLIKLLKEQNRYLPQLEHIDASRGLLDSFDIEDIQITTLLYQTGYLTIQSVVKEEELTRYILAIPNLEVKQSLAEWLSSDYLSINKLEAFQQGGLLYTALNTGKIEEFIQHLAALFAAIPYHNYVNNDISKYEGFYASVVYAFLASRGFTLTAEDVTNKGRIDLTIQTGNYIYIIEFKTDASPITPMMQILDRQYWLKYDRTGKTIHLVGIQFDLSIKNIGSYETQTI